MKASIITYGIGRGGSLCLSNLEKIYKMINSRYDTQYLYIFNSYRHQKKSELLTQAKVSLIDCWTSRVEREHKRAQLFDDVHRDGYVSLGNLLQQFEMLENGLKQTKAFNPDFILYIRDDVLVNPVAIFDVFNRVIKTKKIWFSAFHGNNGYCERFGILPRNSMQSLARYSYIDSYYHNMDQLPYVLRKGLNGEWLYKYIIDQQHTEFICNYTKSTRVRENGQKVRERVIPRPWHANSEWEILKGVIRYYLND